jgi:hypothetical protein
MDPGDEAQAQILSIQSDHTGMDLIQTHCPLQEGLRKGGIMDVGWGEQKEDEQAGAAAQQRMHAISTQEWMWVVCRGVAEGVIRVGTPPRQDVSAIDDQVARIDQAAPQSGEHTEHEEQGRTCSMIALALLGEAGNAGLAIATERQTTDRGYQTTCRAYLGRRAAIACTAGQ